MLRIYSSTHVQPLAEKLAESLSEPLPNPMASDWIAVPSTGMERWLRLELSRKLGAGPLGTDGIAANIEFAFPGSLRGRLLTQGDKEDPWRLEHLVWSVLHILTTSQHPELSVVKQLPPGASWFSRARHVADLLDRYSYHRPRMLADWVAGRWSDGSGGEVPANMRWQPVLWRLVRDHIGTPSPPERLAERLVEIEADPTLADLPPRLAIFGVSTLPGGPQFLQLVRSVGVTRDVGLYLLDPSLAAADAIAGLAAEDPLVGGARVDDRSDSAIINPLLRSWARPTREAQVQVAHAVQDGLAPVERLRLPSIEPSTLLARMQADIVINAAPAGRFVPSPGDNSIQLHSCHGTTRQVEVLRDVILGLLGDDPTLHEEEIVVVAPDLVKFAPLISAVFGTAAPLKGPTQPDAGQPPTLRYRITDRSLRYSYPLLNATALLFELISGRFEASDVLDFCALAPVRERFAFSDDHLAVIGRWVDGANIRWGIDGPHRSRWGMPEDFHANSWRAGLDQLLMGVAVHDDVPSFGPGGVVPYGVEGSDVAILGRFSELVSVLSALVDTASVARPVSEWCALTAKTISQIADVPWSEQWQQQRLAKVLDTIGRDAAVEPAAISLSLGDFRRVLAEYLVPPATRSGFFEGGITVTSLQPMRWLPHRVVCILGADQSVFGSTGVNGDDLVALAPRIGDPDPRGEKRQAMLETMMSAGQHLVVTRTGRDLRTNANVPPAVPVLELLETAAATLHPEHRLELETVHPRQANDELNFRADLPHGSPAEPRSFGFDPRALRGALARRHRFETDMPFLNDPLPAIEVDSVGIEQLQKFFRSPVRYFFQERLEVVFAQANDAKPNHLPVGLDPLERWKLGMELIEAGFSEANAARYIRIQQARGALPPGHLGEAKAAELSTLVGQMFAELNSRNLDPQALEFSVNASIGTVQLGGKVVSWSLGEHPGPIDLTYSAPDGRHIMKLWLDLLAMTATDSAQDWKALGVGRDKSNAKVTTFSVKGTSREERRTNAIAGLARAVDLYKRGLCEPLPLFAKSSHQQANKKSIHHIWDADRFSERSDAYHFEVFGGLDSEAILEIPLRDGDPFGFANDRFRRFAHLLWDAFANTTVDFTQATAK